MSARLFSKVPATPPIKAAPAGAAAGVAAGAAAEVVIERLFSESKSTPQQAQATNEAYDLRLFWVPGLCFLGAVKGGGG